MSQIKESINNPNTTGVGFSLLRENQYKIRGDVFGKIIHPDGREELVLEKRNVYTLDGGILTNAI